tara:strand:- start:60 stop:536 length:477 start_codon:yes stop_codon:yes gene_type:complete
MKTSAKPLTQTHPGVRVQVYRNLRNGLWSVVALEGPDKGRVIAHKPDFIIEECSYSVQPAGNARVRRTGRKNVHAFIRGRVPTRTVMMLGRTRGVTYNPHVHRGFVLEASASQLTGRARGLDAGDNMVIQSSAVRFCADGKVAEGFACDAARWGGLFA